MKASHILVIDHGGLEVWARTRQHLTRQMHFDADNGEGRKRFDDWLRAQAPGTQYAVLIDIPDERFVLEQLPHASAGDTRALTQRRLRQHFPDATFTTSLPLEAGTGDSRLKQVLLCALSHDALVQPWLESVARNSAMISRIDTPPLLLDNWSRRQKGGSSHQLLLSFSRTGMRQTLFHHGRLRFSRLTAARSNRLVECVPFYASELSQTRSYLLAQRLAGHDTALPVVILADAADHDALRAITTIDDVKSFSFIDLSAQFKARAPSGPPESSDARRFLLQLALDKPPASHYAPPALRQEQRLRTIASGLLWAAGSVSAGLIVAAGLALLDANTLRTETDALDKKIASVQAEIGLLPQQQPTLPAAAADIETWLSALNTLYRHAATPAFVFGKSSAIFDRVPALQLESMRWKLAAEGASPSIIVDLDVSLSSATDGSDHSLQRSIRQIETLRPELDLAIETSTYSAPRSVPDAAPSLPQQQLNLRLTLPQPGAHK